MIKDVIMKKLGLLLVSLLIGFSAYGDELLNLTGYFKATRPNIFIYEPTLTAPISELPEYRALKDAGTHLTHYQEASLHPYIIPMLKEAGYATHVLQESDWRQALLRSETQAHIHAMASETDDFFDDDPPQPLFIYLSGTATPQAIVQTIAERMRHNDLFILHPLTPDRAIGEVFVYYPRVVRPGYTSDFYCTTTCWVPTLAAMVSILPPIVPNSTSLIPVLTGSGYPQTITPQPLFILPSPQGVPLPATAQPDTKLCEVRYYDNIPKTLPWIPDLTALLPDQRHFLKGPPLRISKKVLKEFKSQEDTYALTLSGSLWVPETGIVVFNPGKQCGLYWQLHAATLFNYPLDTPQQDRQVKRVPLAAGYHPYHIKIIVAPQTFPTDITINGATLFMPEQTIPKSKE